MYYNTCIDLFVCYFLSEHPLIGSKGRSPTPSIKPWDRQFLDGELSASEECSLLRKKWILLLILRLIEQIDCLLKKMSYPAPSEFLGTIRKHRTLRRKIFEPELLPVEPSGLSPRLCEGHNSSLYIPGPSFVLHSLAVARPLAIARRG